MPLLKRLRVLAAKIESTIGTAESLSSSDAAFNAYDVMFQATIPVTRREAQGSFNKIAGMPEQYMGKATFKVDMGWDGTSTIPTWASTLLPACGWVDSTGTLTPRSEAPGSNVKTVTLACYMNGKLKKLIGAVGNWKMHLPPGKMAYIEFEFTGVWVPPTDVAILSPTYPTATPLRFASATITYNSVALKVGEVVIDAGNEVAAREDGTTAGGLHSYLITDRTPKISAAPESVLVATQDRYGMWLASTEAAFSIVLDGPTNAAITIAAPKAQIMNAQEADRSKIVVDNLEWECNRNGNVADQELSIDFAEAS